MALTTAILQKAAGNSSNFHPSRVTHLQLDNKNISSITGVAQCGNVRVLYLYENNLEDMEPELQDIPKLTHLHLSHNKIQHIENLEYAPNLQKLFMDHNELVSLAGLENCERLFELSVSYQTNPQPLILDPLHLQPLQYCLARLNLSGNRLRDISPLQVLTNLQVLDISHNDIEFAEDLMSPLSSMHRLREIDTRHNPMHTHDMKAWEKVVVITSPVCSLVDDVEVQENQRVFLSRLHQRRIRRQLQNKREDEQANVISSSTSISENSVADTITAALGAPTATLQNDPKHIMKGSSHPPEVAGFRSRRPGENSSLHASSYTHAHGLAPTNMSVSDPANVATFRNVRSIRNPGGRPMPKEGIQR